MFYACVSLSHVVELAMSVKRLLLRQGRMGKAGGSGAPPLIPLGAIALWSGTLATIPANWSLCDGSGGTPNLIARFIRGAPAATDPGTTGGSDSHTHVSVTAAGSHTHTAQANADHSHTVILAGAHHHSVSDTFNSGSNSGFRGTDYTPGAHQHTTNVAGSHTHTMDTTINHTHAISTDDGRPPYYEVAFIQAGAGALVAVGLIIIWTGLLANIPIGWSLCDGGDSRPDLRSKFVRGVNTNVTNPGTTGGATTHLHTETAVVAHSHTMNTNGTHQHTFNLYTWTHSHNVSSFSSGGWLLEYQSDSGAGNHTHANSNNIGSHNHNPMGNDGVHAHVVNSASSLPSYYDVAYIINVSAVTIPTNGILIWTGLLANIPLGYSLCDGGGGRPDLRASFIRGSNAGVNPGGTGGSDTHTHTDQDAGAHNAHSLTSAGAHQHAATNILGEHLHSMASGGNITTADTTVKNLYSTEQDEGGNHSHTYNNEGNHVDHTLTDPGNHTHNPWSTDDGRPAFYEVAFISKD